MVSAGEILVVDGDSSTAEFITEALRDEAYLVQVASDCGSMRAAVTARRPMLILLDLHLPGFHHATFFEQLQGSGLADVPIVAMTTDDRIARQIAAQGIAFCLLKPFELNDLLECVARFVQLCHEVHANP